MNLKRCRKCGEANGISQYIISGNPSIDKKEFNRIAVDLDGVIHAYSKGYHDGTMYDDPIPGAIEGIKKLQKAGYEVYVFTARNNTIPLAKEWLKKHGLDIEVSNIKKPAIYYIDDRAIEFKDWASTLDRIKG